MRISLGLFLICCLCSLSTAFAQPEKVHIVKDVRGEYSVVLSLSDVTGREAMQLARDDARRKALEKVCGVKVSIWDQIETSSAGDTFNSLSVNQIDGEIVEFSVVKEGYYASETRSTETIFYCVANVKVKKSRAPDPNFLVSVNGLKSVYSMGDELLFDVTPNQNSYMKIFLLENENIGYLLYPNEYDKDSALVADKKWSVVDSPYYSFVMQKNLETKKEINRLVFVFTKSEYDFDNQVTSRAMIEKWIATIPNDQKFIYMTIIEIRDK